MPGGLGLCHGVLARSPWLPKCTLTWNQSRHFLCGLLLGLDALDVRCGCRECRVGVSAGCSNGRGEEHAVGTEIEGSVVGGPAWVGRPTFAESSLVLARIVPLRR